MPNDIQAITRESLERDHAPLFAQLCSEFTAAGATAERNRVAAVRGQAMPGHEALIERFLADGVSTAADAAMAILAAERSTLAAAAAAHVADAPKPVKGSAAPDAGAENEPRAAGKQIAALFHAHREGA